MKISFCSRIGNSCYTGRQTRLADVRLEAKNGCNEVECRVFACARPTFARLWDFVRVLCNSHTRMFVRTKYSSRRPPDNRRTGEGIQMHGRVAAGLQSLHLLQRRALTCSPSATKVRTARAEIKREQTANNRRIGREMQIHGCLLWRRRTRADQPQIKEPLP